MNLSIGKCCGETSVSKFKVINEEQRAPICNKPGSSDYAQYGMGHHVSVQS